MSVNVRQVEPDAARARPLADHDVQGKVLHGRVEHLFHDAAQAVDLVDEEDVALVQVGQDGRQVAGPLDGRPGGDLDAHAHLVGDDVGQRGLAQARRAVEQDVIQRLAARLGRLDQDAQVLLDPILADILGQASEGAG